MREIISIRLACAGAQEKKAVKQEEKSQEVYISRMCGATPSGQPNLAHVFISRTLSNMQSFIVIT